MHTETEPELLPEQATHSEKMGERGVKRINVLFGKEGIARDRILPDRNNEIRPRCEVQKFLRWIVQQDPTAARSAPRSCRVPKIPGVASTLRGRKLVRGPRTLLGLTWKQSTEVSKARSLKGLCFDLSLSREEQKDESSCPLDAESVLRTRWVESRQQIRASSVSDSV